MNRRTTISVIILTMNAENTIAGQLAALERQTLPPDEILVVDSASTDGTVRIASAHPLVTVIPIERAAFDHGGTRDLAFRRAAGDFVCFLTQDALPMDNRYLEALMAPFAREKVACACGRQIAREDARPEEKLTREFNYPAQSNQRGMEDLPRLGIKTFFLSDACSAYRREAYMALGGFESPVISNEDMLFAARAVRAGYLAAYCAEARVLHSHAFTLAQEYRRNFDVGVFLEMYREELGVTGVESEGLRYVGFVARGLLKRMKALSFARFGLHCVARLMGVRAGRRYAGLSRARILKRTGNQTFWDRFPEGK
jgi:rhamnosyltransferase